MIASFQVAIVLRDRDQRSAPARPEITDACYTMKDDEEVHRSFIGQTHPPRSSRQGTSPIPRPSLTSAKGKPKAAPPRPAAGPIARARSEPDAGHALSQALALTADRVVLAADVLCSEPTI